MNRDAAHISVESCDAWLETSGAAWCHRLNATITASACLANMYMSERKSSDLRCAGCGGLDNQPEPGMSFLPPIAVIEEPSAKTTDIPVPANEDISEESLNLYRDAPNVGAVTTLNSFHHELLSMLEDDTEEPELEERKPQKVERKERPVRVFIGRCRRCNGYMAAVQERSEGVTDNAVYRCFNCGWRTSPEYQQNRMLAAAGKENVSAAY